MKHVVSALNGSVSTPRFVCDTVEDARRLAKRLNQAGTSVYSLVNLPPARQGASHAEFVDCARRAMKALDPQAKDETLYSVSAVEEFNEGEGEPPISHPFDVMFRQLRDLP